MSSPFAVPENPAEVRSLHVTSASIPDWVPDGSENDPKFACRTMSGVLLESHEPEMTPAKRRKLTPDDYERGVLSADVSILSRAITLVESNRPDHEALAQDLLTRLLPKTGNSIRIGITGVPGAGKSTLIELLGCQLCEMGHRVAVLAVDPSSSVTGGSILGDKTRMQNLVREKNAYIRPSPAGGSLGGVGRKSRETMLLCEAAGYDVILVETVGVGQSEITVRSMVDFFLLIMIAGAGDELQGMKKGVIEIADLLAVNKADGDGAIRAKHACTDYSRILHILQPATPGWKTRCVTCSALIPETVTAIWETIQNFVSTTRESGTFQARRQHQATQWMHALIQDELQQRFFRDTRVRQLLPEIERSVADQTLPVVTAVRKILETFHMQFP
jgi:LAO/AO transport system kinase